MLNGATLIFDGTGSKVSRGLSWILGDASHVAMAIDAKIVDRVADRLNYFMFGNHYPWYILESTTMNTCIDVFTNANIRGVSIVPFQKRVDSYQGSVKVRELFTVGQQKIDEDLLVDIIADVHATPYELSLARLIGAFLDRINLIKKNDDSSIFCSELNALVYQRLNILERREPAEEAHPGDFLKNQNNNLDYIDGNSFLNGYFLGPAIKIKSK